jgi:hypothetical protein
VTLKKLGYYYVEIDGQNFGTKHPLFIFADSPLTDCKSKKEGFKHYFAAGYHDIGPEYKI